LSDINIYHSKTQSDKIFFMAKYYIGTSGWAYKHWKDIFYPNEMPQSHWLEFYSKYFNTVEVNSSFYRQPTQKTINKWVDSVPTNFQFSVKLNRYVTHLKKLSLEKDDLLGLINPFYDFGIKMGPVLIQLPPFYKANSEVLVRFLKSLPSHHKYAFEPRHESWFSPQIVRILRDHNIALVIADSSKFPILETQTADFGYIRFHGLNLYESMYNEDDLEKWAVKIKKWSKKWQEVYIYFNNDAQGHAVKNALDLKQILGVSYGKNSSSS